MKQSKLGRVGLECGAAAIIALLALSLALALDVHRLPFWGNLETVSDDFLSWEVWSKIPWTVWAIVGALLAFVLFRFFLWETHGESKDWGEQQIAHNIRSWTFVFVCLSAINVLVLSVVVAHFHSQGCYDPPENSGIKGCGNFDAIGISVTAVEIGIILVGLIGFWAVRRLTETTARETAETETKTAMQDYLKKNGTKLVKQSLNDGEVISRLQLRLQTFGIDGVDDDQTDQISDFDIDSDFSDILDDEKGGNDEID